MKPAVRFRVRRMRAGDIAGAQRIWRAVFHPRLGDTRRGILRFLSRNPGMSSVAVSGAKVVGVILCGHDGRRGYIYRMAVDSQFRRRGIGTALAHSAVTAFRRARVPRCIHFIGPKNLASQAFWKQVGWKMPEDRGIMTRDIPFKR